MIVYHEQYCLSIIAKINNMDLITNGIVVTYAIKLVQSSKEELKMCTKEEHDKESKEPD
jgi:hypothetical protein